MEELYFGKKRKSTVRKASPKRKLTKKMLDSLSLEKLKKLAKKYKVSCYKKGTKVCVKKSTLLNRLKKSRSIKKILVTVSKMKKNKKPKSPKRTTRRRLHFGACGDDEEDESEFGRHNSRYGNVKTILPNVPKFITPMTLSSGMTYKEMKNHYKNIPSSLLSYNMQGPGTFVRPGKLTPKQPRDFTYNQSNLGRSSMGPYTHIGESAKFGQYFR
jgi:hypothetical protein